MNKRFLLFNLTLLFSCCLGITSCQKGNAPKETFEVTWKNDDNTVLQVEKYNANEMPSFKLGIPKKDPTETIAYSFTNWYPELKPVTCNAEYKAEYKAETRYYKVTWQDYDGTLIKESLCEYRDDPKGFAPPNPERKETKEHTYNFKGWVPELKNVEKDIVYTADYEENLRKYDICWYNDNKELVYSEACEFGTTPEYKGEWEPSKAREEHYTYDFEKWVDNQDKGVSPVYGPANYYPKFKRIPDKYIITWEDDNGTILKEIPTDYDSIPSYGSEVPHKPSDEKYDYTFSGWDPEPTKVTGPATYKATYTKTIRKYKITWKNYDGSTLKEQSVDYGIMPDNPENPTRPSDKQYVYTFDRWYPEVTVANKDTVYCATYTTELNKHKVTFKNDDGNILQESEMVYGATPVYGGETPSKTKDAYEYTFAGWYPEIAPVEDDIEYVARYSKKTAYYDVTWLMDDGTVIEKESYPYNATPSHIPPTKDPSGGYYYDFKGWDRDVVPVTCDTTYKAVFEQVTPEKYPVTFKGTNCLVNGYDSFTDYVEPNSSISYKITPSIGHDYPIELTVFKNDDVEPLDEQYYSFNPNTGEFSMSNVDGFIKLEATCS